jgi:flavin reductase (DIM6/NTAB) family NADH-FMN oxidoreductase RutF
MNTAVVDGPTFRRVMGAVPTTVTVFTIVDGAGVDRGMTVGAFCSVSLNPPLVLACIGNDATIADAMRSVTHFGISVLASHQDALSRKFADTEARTFEGVPHHRGANGMALLDGAVAHLECRVTRRHPGGDHAIVVGEVLAASDHPGTPLVHHRGTYGRLAP